MWIPLEHVLEDLSKAFSPSSPLFSCSFSVSLTPVSVCMSDLPDDLALSLSSSFFSQISLHPLHHRIIYLHPELLQLCSHYPDPVVPILRAYWWGSVGDYCGSSCAASTKLFIQLPPSPLLVGLPTGAQEEKRAAEAFNPNISKD